MRLYDMPVAFNQIEELIMEAGGELTPELETMLDQFQGELANKVDAICALIRQFSLDSTGAKCEVDRLRSLSSVRSRAAERLESYLQTNLGLLGYKRYETPRFCVSVCRNGGRPAIRWTGGDNIPEQYRKVETKTTFDSERAYQDWKEGKELPPGVEIHQGEHLRIK